MPVLTEKKPLSDFIEDDIGFFEDDRDEGSDEDELDVMDEIAETMPKKIDLLKWDILSVELIKFV